MHVSMIIHDFKSKLYNYYYSEGAPVTSATSVLYKDNGHTMYCRAKKEDVVLVLHQFADAFNNLNV